MEPEPNTAAHEETAEELLAQQLALGHTAHSTTKLMRFMMQLTNQNLHIMHKQLVELSRLAEKACAELDEAAAQAKPDE